MSSSLRGPGNEKLKDRCWASPFLAKAAPRTSTPVDVRGRRKAVLAAEEDQRPLPVDGRRVQVVTIAAVVWDRSA